MTATIQRSGGQVTTATVTEPHSLGLSFLRSLLTILMEEIDSSTRGMSAFLEKRAPKFTGA